MAVTTLSSIQEKIEGYGRLNPEEGLYLFQECPLDELKSLANIIRERLHGDVTFFNRNFHIEPTNLCIYDCKFCSYSRELKNRGEDTWYLSKDEIINRVKKYDDQPVTEVHIVGGVHPKMDLEFFCDVIREIKSHRPELHIKGFTAVELYYMFKKAGLPFQSGLRLLQEAGLNSIPGGGAEIFAESIRAQICGDKCSSDDWLAIHKAAHELGIPSNATMLYGHIESYEDRIDHLNRLRDLQDQTQGFNTFIPLKFRNKNNQMAEIPEVSAEEDLRNYAVSRIYLDNFGHIKAYWPMIGRHLAQRSLEFGVDDLDGTIDDTTKIYSFAGAEEQTPAMSTDELVALIHEAGRVAVERDTVYRVIKEFPLPRVAANEG